jgi:ribosomal protein S18 acetylase RimI-like enzyme
MSLNTVNTVEQVFDAIQRAKAGAPAFRTNFFPVQAKLQDWIDHEELLTDAPDGPALFLRKDGDFWRLYFCAGTLDSLQRQLASLSTLKTERVVLDLIGNAPALEDMIAAVEPAGFRRYARLQRMARLHHAGLAPAPGIEPPVHFAHRSEAEAIHLLLESSFDHFADQLPALHEIEAAIAARQILTVPCEGRLGALLFFETQGFTSTLRYWAVAEEFRNRRLGGALMRHYFGLHGAVRRFLLWVVADNHNAVEKYQHYGYLPDGLLDQVLVNEPILHETTR